MRRERQLANVGCQCRRLTLDAQIEDARAGGSRIKACQIQRQARDAQGFGKMQTQIPARASLHLELGPVPSAAGDSLQGQHDRHGVSRLEAVDVQFIDSDLLVGELHGQVKPWIDSDVQPLPREKSEAFDVVRWRNDAAVPDGGPDP